jgi:hypothetical protein
VLVLALQTGAGPVSAKDADLTRRRKGVALKQGAEIVDPKASANDVRMHRRDFPERVGPKNLAQRVPIFRPVARLATS